MYMHLSTRFSLESTDYVAYVPVHHLCISSVLEAEDMYVAYVPVHHLYISSVLEAEEGTSTSIKVRLPLNNGTSCSLHAILERNPTNTVTLHLQPDVIVINRCPVPIRVLTTLQEREDEGEGGMELDIESPLNPNNVSIIPQSKVHVMYVHVLMRDEKEGRKKQARSNKQQGKATQLAQSLSLEK